MRSNHQRFKFIQFTYNRAKAYKRHSNVNTKNYYKTIKNNVEDVHAKKKKRNLQMFEEANQEAKREVCNDRQGNRNGRELHISDVSNKDIRKRIDPIIAPNVKCYRACNCP
jgi:hypothetical protein